jgi:hypothetical protein
MPAADLVPVVAVDNEAVPRSNGALASEVLNVLLEAFPLMVCKWWDQIPEGWVNL